MLPLTQSPILDLVANKKASNAWETPMSEFSLDTSMNEVERTFPFAKVLLHAKFHLGGCSKCGYEPEETIAEVANKHSKDKNALLEALNIGVQDMSQCEVSPSKMQMVLESVHQNTLLIDVREPWEFELVHLPGSVLLSETNMEQLFTKAQSSELVVMICHHGVRSMNAAMFFRQNGVPHAYSLQGGLDAYSRQIDPALPRY
jgi:rhodanese-related sulfurtransferase